jgi:acyl-CoA dehydrogenase family protein 9
MALGILSLAHLSIGVKAVLLFGTDEQKKKYLPLAASGEMIFCYALTEPLTGSDAKNIDTAAKLSPDGKYYLLNGSKTFITNANYAGGLTVFAQMDESKKGTLGAFIVETGWEGVTVGRDMEKMGLKASSTGSFNFKDVKVPRENLIGNPGDGFKIAMTILNYGRLALGAASSGMLKASLDDMLKRANRRIQFGRPIVEYELIQDKIVKAFAGYQSAWAMTNFTAGLLENNPVGYIAVESSHCKLYGTNKAWESLYDAMQVAGGSGYLKNNPYEKRMRDFRVATIFEGTTEIHSIYPPVSMLKNIAKQIYGKPAFMRMLILSSKYLGATHLNIKSRNNVLKKSLNFIVRHAGLFRRNFICYMMKYGKKMPEMELLLRRLTETSYRIYAVFSLMMKIISLKENDALALPAYKALSYCLNDYENITKEDWNIDLEKTGAINRTTTEWLNENL